MKKILVIFLFLLINSFIFSQIIIDSTATTFYQAKVLDNNNNPIFFVLITADGIDSTYNDPTGRFLLIFPDSLFSASLTINPLIKFYNEYFEEYSKRIAISKGDSIIGDDVILTPKEGFTINGYIKFENDEPVSNAYVCFYGVNNSRWYYTATNTEGNYSIQVQQGSYYIYSSVGYQFENAWTYREKYYNNKPNLSEADILEVNDNVDEINFIFPLLQVGSISGKVKDAGTQNPLSNVFVMASTAEPGDSTAMGTDQNGNFSIQVFEGDYILYAFESGYFLQFYKDSDNPFDATPVTVGPGNLNITGIDFNLTRPEQGTNIITGSVRELYSYQLPNVQVFAIPLAGGNWTEAKSDYNGRYFLRDITNGKYILLFNKTGYASIFYKDAYYWEDALIFDLTGNQSINADDVFLNKVNPFGGEISGKITSNTGADLSGTMITAVNSTDSLISNSFSIYDGSYKIPSLSTGDYKIKASKVGYETVEYANTVQIDISSQPIVNGVDFTINLTDVDNTVNPTPEFFTLYQNYPNPFNPSTTIEYNLAGSSEVTITIYDILSREIDFINEGWKMAGSYSLNWSGEGFPSGIYFCKLKAGNNIKIIKMVLVR